MKGVKFCYILYVRVPMKKEKYAKLASPKSCRPMQDTLPLLTIYPFLHY